VKQKIQRYKSTLFLALFFLLIAGYPLLVTVINPIPEREDLQTISAKIIELKKDAPSMKVQYPNGDVQTLYFPQTLYWIARGDGKFFLTSDYRDQLLNCVAEMKIIKIKWLFPSRFRVWEINCLNQSISFEKFSLNYAREENYTKWMEVFAVFLLFLILVKKFKADQGRS
jgi:hypothetical protein